MVGFVYYPIPEPSTSSDNAYAYGDYTDGVSFDNGKIFAFAKNAAKKRLTSTVDGDIYVPIVGYDAIISTLLYPDEERNRTYAKDFNELCPENATYAGCAMFAMEFYGGDDKTVSRYSYQVSLSPYYQVSFLSEILISYNIYNSHLFIYHLDFLF